MEEESCEGAYGELTRRAGENSTNVPITPTTRPAIAAVSAVLFIVKKYTTALCLCPPVVEHRRCVDCDPRQNGQRDETKYEHGKAHGGAELARIDADRMKPALAKREKKFGSNRREKATHDVHDRDHCCGCIRESGWIEHGDHLPSLRAYHAVSDTLLADMAARLILVRHGESRWNLVNRFTGWVDVPLSQRGVEEALACATKLQDIHIDHACTSKLERAHETLSLILSRQELTGIYLHAGEKKQMWYSCEHHSEKTEILVHTTSLLNERYYGHLQGLDKDHARKQFGEDAVLQWRRSYDSRPPGGESLADVYKRTIPFFLKRIVPFLDDRKNIIIASHGNTLRAILKYLEKIPNTDLPYLNLIPGEPIIYAYQRKKFGRLSGELPFDRPMLWDPANVLSP